MKRSERPTGERETVDMPATTEAKMLSVRTQGIKLQEPIGDLVSSLTADFANANTIDDLQAFYHEADHVLSQVVHNRAVWRTKMDPVLAPYLKILEEAKEGIKGAKALDGDIDGPMERQEEAVKRLMKDSKLKERQLLEEAREADRVEAQRKRDEAARKEAQSKAAATPQMKARLDTARAKLEEEAVAIEDAAEELQPVKAASSSDRWKEKCVIEDMGKFIAAMQDYPSTDHVYKMKTPPLSILQDPKVMAAIQVVMNRIWAGTPGVVKSWPGVKVFEDVTIAKR